MEFKKKKHSKPLILMGYFNLILQYGTTAFLKKCRSVGVDGLIIVDLPYEESTYSLNKLNSQNIDLIRLISPTTTDERIDRILSSSSGYLYYVSLKGVTGSDLKVSDDLEVDNCVKGAIINV
jgi:tryptophan synthase alpha chain